jgi:uncharacterized protein with HEPN domain
MHDVELAREVLRQIHASAHTVLRRFEPIRSPDDFTASDEGMEKLDAICMQLIAIGEGVKNLDKVTGGSLLPGYPQVDWKRVMGMRDILSHHYFDVDAEVVYAVCANHVENLAVTVQVMLDDLQ